MANRKSPTRTSNRKPRPDVAELEKRINALERRVAILEAKHPRPTLAEQLTESASSERSATLAQEE